jgi:hypothetical protein
MKKSNCKLEKKSKNIRISLLKKKGQCTEKLSWLFISNLIGSPQFGGFIISTRLYILLDQKIILHYFDTLFRELQSVPS